VLVGEMRGYWLYCGVVVGGVSSVGLVVCM